MPKGSQKRSALQPRAWLRVAHESQRYDNGDSVSPSVPSTISGSTTFDQHLAKPSSSFATTIDEEVKSEHAHKDTHPITTSQQVSASTSQFSSSRTTPHEDLTRSLSNSCDREHDQTEGTNPAANETSPNTAENNNGAQLDLQSRLQTLLQKLGQVAKLRKAVISKRAVVKEKARLVLNLQDEFLKRTQSLREKLRQRTSQASEEVPQTWELEFQEIEEFVSLTIKTLKELDIELRLQLDADWDMCELDEEINARIDNEGVSTSPIEQHPVLLVHEDRDRDEYYDLSQPMPLGELYRRDTNDDLRAVHEDQLHAGNAALYIADDYSEIPYAEPGDFTSPEYDNGMPISPPQSESVSPGSSPKPTPKDNNEANLDDVGAQFVLVDIESGMYDPENLKAGILQNGETKSNITPRQLRNFSRWLLQGMPWNGQTVTSREDFSQRLYDTTFLRIWIFDTLFSITQDGLPTSMHPESGIGRTFAQIQNFVKDWLLEPETNDDRTVNSPPTAKERYNPVEGQGLTKRFEQTRLDDGLSSTADSAAPHLPYSPALFPRSAQLDNEGEEVSLEPFEHAPSERREFLDRQHRESLSKRRRTKSEP